MEKIRKAIACLVAAIFAFSIVSATPVMALASPVDDSASAAATQIVEVADETSADEESADESDFGIPTAVLETTNDYVRGAATRAAMPVLDILGVNSVEESGQFVSMVAGIPQYTWDQPKYILFASTYNDNPSPLLANLATGLGTEDYPAAVYLSSRTGGGSGPNASLGEDDTDVWGLEPAIVVGTGGGDEWYENYEAVGVEYSFSDYEGLIDTVHAIADEADELGDLRYGSAEEIADRYEAYITGTIDYLKDKGYGASSRTVALVDGVNDDGTFSILQTGAAAGTASTNRYLETTVSSELATNLADDGSEESVNDGSVDVTAAQLASCDLIMIGGQQGQSDFSTIAEALHDVKIDSEGNSLLTKTFFVEDNGSNGAAYGTIMNSVENAQNIGRILGCLYSNEIDQQDFIAYYYDEFYHISDTGLPTVMKYALGGVRNWDEQSDAGAETADEAIAMLCSWDDNGGYTSDTAKSTVESIIGVSSDTGEQS